MAYSKTILVGNITKDPELKHTPNGTAVCAFDVAVKRKRQEVTDFHKCVAWSKTAETISRYFAKGQEILVEGELQNRSYEDSNGIKRYVTELNVETFSFTSRKRDNEPAFEEYDEDEGNGDLPF